MSLNLHGIKMIARAYSVARRTLLESKLCRFTSIYEHSKGKQYYIIIYLPFYILEILKF